MTANQEYLHLLIVSVISGSTFWLIVGFVGQTIYGCRFLVQWIVSEIKQESTVPLAFWFFSVGGGIILLAYAIHRKDPVFIVGQAGGLLIYSRNLMLIYRKRARDNGDCG